MPDFPGRLKALEPFWNGWYLDAQLGEGSFGAVYRIYREEFGQRTQAAMKWIPLPRYQGEIDSLRGSGMSDAKIQDYYGDLVREMQTEITLMSSLRGSSHIVSMEDYAFFPRQNEIGWDILIRMELLQPLTKRLQSSMTVGDVVRMGVDLCDALSLCGKKQIIHRDIKPDNIFVNEFGDYKLGDFGEARRLRREQTTMSVRGTLNYMAPEVHRGEKGDATLDQYSLGLVMHRLLNAQQLPFAPTFDRVLTHTEWEAAFLQRMQGKPVPPPVQGSQRLKDAVCRACSHQPKKRYPTIEGFRADLEAALNDPECAEPLARLGQIGESLSGTLSSVNRGMGKRPRWLFALLGVMVTGMVITGGMLLLGGDGGEADPTEPPSVTATATPEETEAPTEAPTEVSTEPPTLTQTATPTTTPTAAPWSGPAYAVGENGMLYSSYITEAILRPLEQSEVVMVSGQQYQNGELWHTVRAGDSWGYVQDRHLQPMSEAESTAYYISIATPSPTPWPYTSADAFEAALNENGGLTITGYVGTDTVVDIPPMIDGVPVTAIGSAVWDADLNVATGSFAHCGHLVSVTIPEGVTSIGDRAFTGCAGLTEITVPASVTSIGELAFSDCGSLTGVALPEGVTSIGTGAFWGCGSLMSFKVPENITHIGNLVFAGCGKLASVTIPEGVTGIGNEAFWGCGSLTDIVLPASVTSIGYRAFRGCGNLTDVTIPEGVTDIGSGTFWECSSLTSVTLPAGVTVIDDFAFSDCGALTSIAIPAGVTVIEDYVFKGCGNLTGVTIPDGVTIIGEEAFQGCESLTGITLPEGLTDIGKRAFAECSGLTDIVLPASVTGIGTEAFRNCHSLTVYALSDSYADNYARENNMRLVRLPWPSPTPDPAATPRVYTGAEAFRTKENADGGLTITKYVGASSMVDIPPTIDGVPVTAIGESAFSDCDSLTGVTIPEGVTSIGYAAFRKCVRLKSVTIPEGVTSIEDSVFMDCHSLTGITIPESVTRIKSGAFRACKSLTSITIPGGVTSIGDSAFWDCSELTDITLPESVTSIGGSAFKYCSSLMSITIPQSVTAIGDYAFFKCLDLTIHAPSGSYAETYAKGHFIPFTPLQ